MVPWQFTLHLPWCRGIYDAFKAYVGLPTTGGAAPPEKKGEQLAAKGEQLANKVADKISA